MSSLKESSGHVLSCRQDEYGSVDIYRTLARLHGVVPDPYRAHPGKVVLSVPLTGLFYRARCEVVVRGPGCCSFDLPLLKGRDTLVLVFPFSTIFRASQMQTSSRLHAVIPGPRICNDVFAHGLALALNALIDIPGTCVREVDSLVRVLAAHIALEYGSYARSPTAARLDPTETAAAQRLLDDDRCIRPDIGRIAGIFGLSLTRFERAYKRATGLTPYAWWLARRKTAQDLAGKHGSFHETDPGKPPRPGLSDVFANLPHGAQIWMRGDSTDYKMSVADHTETR